MSLPYLNSTQIPNIIFDYWMEKLTPAEFKALLCICRKTYGWHKARDSISITQIQKLTGLSRRGIFYSLTRLQEWGLVKKDMAKTELGDNDTNFYEIHLEMSPGGGALSAPGVVNSVHHGVVHSVHLQKKEITKERLTKEDSAPPSGASPPPALSDPPKRKQPPAPKWSSADLKERLPSHAHAEEFNKTFNTHLVGISDKDHQALVAKHGEAVIAQAYDFLADWKLSKAETEPHVLKKHTDFHRLKKWALKEIIASAACPRTTKILHAEENEQLAKKVAKCFPLAVSSGKIVLGHNYIEFVVGMHSYPVKFSDHGFKEQVAHNLAKLRLSLHDLE